MKEAAFLLCQGCLSIDRKCHDINENYLNVFLRILDPNGDPKAGCQFFKSVVLCWECEATLRKFKAFQMKIQKAQNVLKDYYLSPNINPQCLSTLKTITKTKYDADINTSLQFLEITITKIDANLKTTSDDTFPIKKDSSSPIKDEFDIISNESPEICTFSKDNHDFSNDNCNFSNDNCNFSNDNCNFSNDNYDINDSDHNSDDKSIIEFKLESKVLKKKGRNKSNIDKKANDMSKPFRGQTIRYKDVTNIKSVVNIKKRKGSANIKQNELKKSMHTTDTEEDDGDTEEEKSDPTFNPGSNSVKPKNLKNKKYTKIQIDKDNVQQYFTEYTLSESEYRVFLEKLSKTPYFMNSKKVCAKCVVVFVNEEDYLEHMKLHDSNNGNLSCSLCDIYFFSDNQYQDHTRAHLTVHQCNICKQTCGLQHSLSAHIGTVHKGLVYKCRECKVLFISRAAMCKHINLLHERFVCNNCGKVEHSRETMSQHMRVKHLPPIYRQTRAKITRYTSLLGHNTRKCTNKYKMEDLYCVECDKQFTSWKRFWAHTRDVHILKSQNIRWPCPKCDKILTSKKNLNNHYKLFHGGGTKHRCDICNKCYGKGDGLRRHKALVHQKIALPKTIVCETCGRCFQSKAILKNHIRTHTGERPYECSHCGARFTQKYPRDLHERKIHLPAAIVA